MTHTQTHGWSVNWTSGGLHSVEVHIEFDEGHEDDRNHRRECVVDYIVPTRDTQPGYTPLTLHTHTPSGLRLESPATEHGTGTPWQRAQMRVTPFSRRERVGPDRGLKLSDTSGSAEHTFREELAFFGDCGCRAGGTLLAVALKLAAI